MSNIDIYKNAFVEAFEVEIEEVTKLEYESIPEWDSVGHMVLMAAFEKDLIQSLIWKT